MKTAHPTRLTRLLALAALLGAAAGCASPNPAPIPGKLPDLVVLEDGQRIRGEIRAQRIHIPAGAVVTAEADVLLWARRQLLIEGTLLAADRSVSETEEHGPRIVLRSRDLLTVVGEVRGGRGRCWSAVDPKECVGRPGGAGSSIYMIAPDQLVWGLVQPGAGGQGGGAATGGPGGSIYAVGDPMSDHDLDPVHLETDPERRQGFDGASGGRGGQGIAGVDTGSGPGTGGNSGAPGGMHFADWDQREQLADLWPGAALDELVRDATVLPAQR